MPEKSITHFRASFAALAAATRAAAGSRRPAAPPATSRDRALDGADPHGPETLSTEVRTSG